MKARSIGFSIAPAVFLAPLLLLANPQPSRAKTFAQELVEQALANHPEVDEVGIAVRSSRGCRTIASTDKSDLGEACEKDDLAPMQDGKPYIESEKDGYDVSVPLRNTEGKIIGSLGIGFKRARGHGQAEVIADARKISEEMAARISSKARLFDQVK